MSEPVKRLAVLGQPIAHSRSPAMQRAALAELGLGEGWSYEAIEVSPEAFDARVRAMPDEGFVGANVTVPHKLAALAIADSATRAAREIGAANTLSFTPGGIAADNTDATGILDALPREARGMRTLIMGAGGSARAAVWALCGAGADVVIWNRTPERARALAQELGGSPAHPSAGGLQAADFDLIVNATTVGMQGSSSDLKALPIAADGLSERHLVVDLVYGPAETALAAAARLRGATVVDGLEVLVRQGAASLRLWTGREPPLEVMRRAARSGWTTTGTDI